MSVNFEKLEKLVSDAKAEQDEFTNVDTSLEGLKGQLQVAQEAVAEKQAEVDEARVATGKEKDDVITKLQELQTEVANAILLLQG